MAVEKHLITYIKSNRPAANGKAVKGLSGEGVILADDPDTVYVTGDSWYGGWPISETSVPEARVKVEEQRKADEEASRRASVTAGQLGAEVATFGESVATVAEAFERLTKTLKAASPGIETTTTGYLLTRDGKYIRLPDEHEFTQSFDELDRQGKVQP